MHPSGRTSGTGRVSWSLAFHRFSCGFVSAYSAWFAVSHETIRLHRPAQRQCALHFAGVMSGMVCRSNRRWTRKSESMVSNWQSRFSSVMATRQASTKSIGVSASWRTSASAPARSRVWSSTDSHDFSLEWKCPDKLCLIVADTIMDGVLVESMQRQRIRRVRALESLWNRQSDKF